MTPPGELAVRAHYPDEGDAAPLVEVVQADEDVEMALQLYEQAQAGTAHGVRMVLDEQLGELLVIGTPPFPRAVYRVVGASQGAIITGSMPVIRLERVA